MLTELCGRIDDLVRQRQGRRVIVGLVGLPGSGKTTMADALVTSLLQWHADWTDHRTDRVSDPERPWIGSHVAHVPMDGFHLADVELRRLRRGDRKGAPDTFDAAGYAALLQRLRHSDDDVWAPAFDRTIEQPIAGSIPVLRHTRVVITEGNYLLLEDPVWATARSHIDAVWFYDLDDDVRRQRLINRHIRFGKSPAAAVDWVNGPDQRNAELIDATRDRADLIIHDAGLGPAAVTAPGQLGAASSPDRQPTAAEVGSGHLSRRRGVTDN
jgi:pantothenate kinase